jgi:hypothetical protein
VPYPQPAALKKVQGKYPKCPTSQHGWWTFPKSNRSRINPHSMGNFCPQTMSRSHIAFMRNRVSCLRFNDVIHSVRRFTMRFGCIDGFHCDYHSHQCILFHLCSQLSTGERNTHPLFNQKDDWHSFIQHCLFSFMNPFFKLSRSRNVTFSAITWEIDDGQTWRRLGTFRKIGTLYNPPPVLCKLPICHYKYGDSFTNHSDIHKALGELGKDPTFWYTCRGFFEHIRAIFINVGRFSEICADPSKRPTFLEYVYPRIATWSAQTARTRRTWARLPFPYPSR